MAAERRRRWPWLLGAFVLLLAIGAIFVNAQLEPHRLAATVLGKAGESLQLRLSFHGTPEYAFRPEPRLVLPGFSAAARNGEVFLSARRAEISLPWSTITGNEPVITRIELDAPVIELPGLQRWLASRPPTPFKLPTIRHGLAVREGELRAGTWSLRALSLELPKLQAGEAAKLQAKGIYASGKTVLPFDLDAIAATPGLASPIDLKLKLQLAEDALPDGKRPPPNPIGVSLLGRYSWKDPLFTLEADKLAVIARSPLPSFEGKGKLESANLLYLDFDAVLGRWPEAWPKLPASVAAGGDKLPVHVSYEGKRDLSDWLQLSAARDGSEIQASLHLSELQQWLAADAASPLPPLQGRLKTPSLVLDGVELEGVEVELSDGGGTKAAP